MPGPPSIASSDSSGGGAPLRPRADSSTFNQLNQHGNSQKMNAFSSSQMMHPNSGQAFAPQFGNATQQPLPPHQVYNPQKPALTPQRKHIVPQEYGFHLPEPFPPPQTIPAQQRIVAAQPAVIPNQPSRTVEDEASLMDASRSFGNNNDSSLKPISKVALSTPVQVHQPNTSHGIKTEHRQRGSRSKKHYPHHVNPLQMHPVHIQTPNQNQNPQVNQLQIQPPVRPHTRLMARPQTRQSNHSQVQQPSHSQVQQANNCQHQQMNQSNTQSSDQVNQQQLIPYNSHPVVQVTSQQAAQVPAGPNDQPVAQQQLNQPKDGAPPAWHPDPINPNFVQQVCTYSLSLMRRD